MFMHVSRCSKMRKMCDKSVENNLKVLKFVPDYFKIQEMCEKAVIQLLSAIVYVPVSAKNSTYV